MKRLIVAFFILRRHKKVRKLALRPFFQDLMTVRTIFRKRVVFVRGAVNILEFIGQRTLLEGCQTGKRPLGFRRNSGITSMDEI